MLCVAFNTMNNLDTKIDPNHAENTATVSQIFNFTNKYPKTQERKMICDIKKGQAYENKICMVVASVNFR